MVKKVVVVGVGTIGKSIALHVAQTNHEVTVVAKLAQESFNTLCSGGKLAEPSLNTNALISN